MKVLIFVSALAIGLADIFIIGFMCFVLAAMIESIKEHLEERRRNGHGK